MKAWKKELNARKERIDNTHLKEVRVLLLSCYLRVWLCWDGVSVVA